MPQLDFNVLLSNFLLVLAFFCFFYLFLSFFFLRRLFSIIFYRNLWDAQNAEVEQMLREEHGNLRIVYFSLVKKILKGYHLLNVK